MSTLEVNTIKPISGSSTVTLGESGNTIALASGASQTLAANTPAFHVTRSSNQSIATSTVTKIQWNNEILDTDNAYDNSTNYRFTPQVSGQYIIGMHIRLNSSDDFDQNFISIRKNGSDILQSYYENKYYNGHFGQVLVQLNGSSDYIEFFVHQSRGGDTDLDSNDQNCYAFGYKVIGV
jgi:hypothetical protein